MRDPTQAPVTETRGSSEARIGGQASVAPNPAERDGQAAQGPSPEPVSAAHNAAPAPPSDSPAEAQGRRVLSTAFVRLGAGDHLSVELRNGRAVVLRDVVMRRSDYCGLQVTNGAPPARFCGGYADVAAARPISAPARDAPDPVAAREGESRAGDRMHGPSSRD